MVRFFFLSFRFFPVFLVLIFAFLSFFFFLAVFGFSLYLSDLFPEALRMSGFSSFLPFFVSFLPSFLLSCCICFLAC